MSDWSGSESQRRRDRGDCLYPDARPTPPGKVYRIKAGTKATANGKFIRTRKDLEFDSPQRVAGKRLEFFRCGWVLSVDAKDVVVDSARSGNLNG